MRVFPGGGRSQGPRRSIPIDARAGAETRSATEVHSNELLRHNAGVLAALLAAVLVTFPTGHAVLHTPSKDITVKVQIAQTPQQLARGLMDRRSLARNAGMAFLFGQPTHGSFWMKGTRWPLSIAFWNENGRILRMLDMRTCQHSPCRAYNPHLAFWGALEVNRGSFRRWDVSTGDVIEIQPD